MNYETTTVQRPLHLNMDPISDAGLSAVAGADYRTHHQAEAQGQER